MGIPRAELDAQLGAVATFQANFVGKELAMLHELLAPGEVLRAAVSGSIEASNWLAVATSHRILIVHKGILGGVKQINIPYGAIQRLEHKLGLLFGSLDVVELSGSTSLKQIPKSDLKNFMAAVASQYAGGLGTGSVSATVPADSAKSVPLEVGPSVATPRPGHVAAAGTDPGIVAHVIAVVLFVGLPWLTCKMMCGDDNTEPTPPSDRARAETITPSPQPRPELPPLETGVVLEMEVQQDATSRPVVRGVTNLPDGTALMITVRSRTGFNGSDRQALADGRFTAGPFGAAGGLPDGEYVAEVMTPDAWVQPDHVQAAFGPHGVNLKGDLVTNDDGERRITKRITFSIGDPASAAATTAASVAENKKKARTVYSELEALIAIGLREFQRVRNKDDMASAHRCGELMHGHANTVKRAERVRAIADTLPRDQYLDLIVASNTLLFCATCSPDGASDCKQARAALRKAKKSLR